MKSLSESDPTSLFDAMNAVTARYVEFDVVQGGVLMTVETPSGDVTRRLSDEETMCLALDLQEIVIEVMER